MVAPRGGTGRGVSPPLATATIRHSKKTMAPDTVTKTPAHEGRRTSPRHTQSTNAAASTLTKNLVAQARKNSSTPSDPVSTSLFHSPSYATAAATTGYDNNNNTQYGKLQALLSPPPPLPEVANDERVEESQLTTTTGLGDDFLSSPGSTSQEEERAGEHNDGNLINPFENNYDNINDDDGVDENVNDYAADKYDFNFNQRLHHYMELSEISSHNVRAVEYCCMMQVNTIVYNHQTKGRVELDDKH